MKNLFTKFVKEEEGSLVEYLILIAVAGVIAAFFFPGIKTAIGNWFNKMVGNVDAGLDSTDPTLQNPSTSL